MWGYVQGSGSSLVGYISCGLLVLVLCEGLSRWGQALGRCWRSGWGCDSGFDVGLRQDGVGYTPTVSWLVAEGSLGLRWGGIGRALSVCFLLVM